MTDLGGLSRHLTEDVIDRAFKVKTCSQDCVRSIKVTRAAPAGEGLIGALHRIHVTGDQHQTSFVLKTIVKDELLKKSLKNTHKYFNREIYFFKTILPALLDTQKSLGAKENFQKNVPIYYASFSDGANDFILMEDLKERHLTSNPENPTKYERDANLKTLAHLHAVSIALKLKRPEQFKQLTCDLEELYYNEDNRGWYAKYLQNAINIDLISLAETEGTSSVYYKKFVELVSKDPYGQMMEIAADKGEHLSLCHGDAWCSNFMSRDGVSVAVDFQLLRCCSPVSDVLEMLTMCSNLCSDKDILISCLKLYYESLIYYLEDMGVEAFTWNDFNMELKKYGKFGLLKAMSSIPLMASKRCDVLEPLAVRYAGMESIPLEMLWQLTPIEEYEKKMCLSNAVRVAVDLGFI